MFKHTAKPVRLMNIRNNQVVICEDYSNVRTIDGQDFVEVHTENNPRKFWLNKAPLIKVKTELTKKR
jgi:hypothetical protein